MEIWKDIKDYEGLYQISNLGRVKSLARIVIHSNGKSVQYKEKILSNNSCSGYYRVIGLTKDKISKLLYIHRLVYQSFVGELINGMQVDHRDNNKINNIPKNLQQISNRRNSSKDQFRHSRSSKYIGVCWHKTHGKWYSSIKINKKCLYLGLFDNEIDAAMAYQDKLKTIN